MKQLNVGDGALLARIQDLLESDERSVVAYRRGPYQMITNDYLQEQIPLVCSSPATVKRRLSRLRDAGIIEIVTHRRGEGQGSERRVRVLPAWAIVRERLDLHMDKSLDDCVAQLGSSGTADHSSEVNRDSAQDSNHSAISDYPGGSGLIHEDGSIMTDDSLGQESLSYNTEYGPLPSESEETVEMLMREDNETTWECECGHWVDRFRKQCEQCGRKVVQPNQRRLA